MAGELTKEEIAQVLEALDMCLEEGRCRTTPEKVWEEVAKSIDGRSAEQLQCFFMDWEDGLVDVAYEVAYARAGRNDGNLVNIYLDTSVYLEEDFQSQLEAGLEVEDDMTKACKLCFPVSIVKRMLEDSMQVDQDAADNIEDDDEGGEDEDEDEDEEGDLDADHDFVEAAASCSGQEQSGAEDQEAMDSTETEEIQTSSEAAVFTAAVLEYVAAELVELAGNCAMNNRHDCIQTSDIQRAIHEDELLLRAFPDASLQPATLPRVLTDAAAPFRVDIYWRATDRYPGGNLDTFTVRYRFDMQPDSYQVGLDYHRNWDGVHHIGGGVLAELGGVEQGLCGRVREALASVVRSSGVTQGLGGWTVLDTTAHDSNSFDTEWSTVELLAFAVDAKQPFLSLRQARVLGPQYRPAPQYTPKLTAPSPEQEAALQTLTAAVGMGRPQQYSEGACSAAQHQHAVPSVQLPAGLPPVQPEYFRF